jgi:hypothetical protein
MPDDHTPTPGTGEGNEGDSKGSPSSFEEYLKGQDETVRGLFDDHVKGLKGALDSERGSRKEMEKQIRELAGKADKGSDAERQLTKLADDLSDANVKADFYEKAHDSGIRNLRLAYQVARLDGLIDARGRIDFDRMKKDYPELFAQTPATRNNAGSGTQTPAAGAGGMNDFIRRAAGR